MPPDIENAYNIVIDEVYDVRYVYDLVYIVAQVNIVHGLHLWVMSNSFSVGYVSLVRPAE